MGRPPEPNRLFFNIVQTKKFVADFVYFWALFGAIIRNIIRNINVQKRVGGGSKAVWTMLKKNQTIWLWRASLSLGMPRMVKCYFFFFLFSPTYFKYTSFFHSRDFGPLRAVSWSFGVDFYPPKNSKKYDAFFNKWEKKENIWFYSRTYVCVRTKLTFESFSPFFLIVPQT